MISKVFKKSRNLAKFIKPRFSTNQKVKSDQYIAIQKDYTRFQTREGQTASKIFQFQKEEDILNFLEKTKFNDQKNVSQFAYLLRRLFQIYSNQIDILQITGEKQTIQINYVLIYKLIENIVANIQFANGLTIQYLMNFLMKEQNFGVDFQRLVFIILDHLLENGNYQQLENKVKITSLKFVNIVQFQFKDLQAQTRKLRKLLLRNLNSQIQLKKIYTPEDINQILKALVGYNINNRQILASINYRVKKDIKDYSQKQIFLWFCLNLKMSENNQSVPFIAEKIINRDIVKHLNADFLNFLYPLLTQNLIEKYQILFQNLKNQTFEAYYQKIIEQINQNEIILKTSNLISFYEHSFETVKKNKLLQLAFQIIEKKLYDKKSFFDLILLLINEDQNVEKYVEQINNGKQRQANFNTLLKIYNHLKEKNFQITQNFTQRIIGKAISNFWYIKQENDDQAIYEEIQNFLGNDENKQKYFLEQIQHILKNFEYLSLQETAEKDDQEDKEIIDFFSDQYELIEQKMLSQFTFCQKTLKFLDILISENKSFHKNFHENLKILCELIKERISIKFLSDSEVKILLKHKEEFKSEETQEVIDTILLKIKTYI